MDAFGRVVAVMLAAVLIFIMPVRYLLLNYETHVKDHVHNETNRFAEEVMEKGFLTLEMYTLFIENLNPAKSLYNIELIHSVPKEGQQILKEGNPIFKVQNLNTIGQSLKSQEPDDYEHVHSEDCYEVGEDISDRQPLCSMVVIDIIPLKPNQTIKLGEDLETRVTAHYLDGSSQIIDCISDYSGELGEEIVTLTYTGLIDNAKTIGIKATTINVNTINIKVPISLKVLPSENVVQNGVEPSYTLTLNYDDGSTEIITDGYIKSGFTLGAGRKEVTFTYETVGIILSDTIIIDVLRNTKTCENGHIYKLDDFDNDFGCLVCANTITSIHVSPTEITIERGEELEIYIMATYMDGHKQLIEDNVENDFDPNRIGKQLVTFYYEGFQDQIHITVVESFTCSVCGYIYFSDEYGIDLGCPNCSERVVEIVAEPDFVIVPLGEELILDVTVIYQDGESEKVTDWTSNFNGNKPGLQQVMVFYENVLTTISVYVENSEETVCPICNSIYSKIEYPNECPLCSKLVMGIEASLLGGGIVKLGSELELFVDLLFFDGHRELATNGWVVSGFNPYLLGLQNITITYGTYETTLTIEVVEHTGLGVCDLGHYYFLNFDGSDPGCPYCTNPDSITELTQTYMDAFYTDYILNELYTKGKYFFNEGDYFTIKIWMNPIAYMRVMSNLLFANIYDFKYTYGGVVYGKFL